jgi:hypothetical protein
MSAQPDLFEKLRKLWAQTVLTGDDIELDMLALRAAAFRARALMRLAELSDLTEVLERVEDVHDLVDAANLIADIADAKRVAAGAQ